MESPKITTNRSRSSNTSAIKAKLSRLSRESFYSSLSREDEHTQFHEDIICSICSEILIKATTLNCSHTFCKYCIERWRAKQADCPICRSKIQYQVPTLILDNIIEKIVQNFPKFMRRHRSRILNEREKNKTLSSKSSKNIRIPSTSNSWIRMRRMNGLSSYYLIPNYRNARRPLNEVTFMYFEDDPEWEDLGDEVFADGSGTSNDANIEDLDL